MSPEPRSAKSPNPSPWPLVLVLVFLVFIAAAVSYIVYAVRQPVHLVRPDYYVHEIQYQERIQETQNALPWRDQILCEHRPQKGVIRLQFPTDLAGESMEGTVQLYRPSDAVQDRVLPLEFSPEGIQVIDSRALARGKWLLKMEWTVGTNAFYLEKSLFLGE